MSLGWPHDQVVHCPSELFHRFLWNFLAVIAASSKASCASSFAQANQDGSRANWRFTMWLLLLDAFPHSSVNPGFFLLSELHFFLPSPLLPSLPPFFSLSLSSFLFPFSLSFFSPLFPSSLLFFLLHLFFSRALLSFGLWWPQELNLRAQTFRLKRHLHSH